MIAILIGVLLAIGVGVFARAVGFDRDRAFYPAVTIVIAGYYVLFAAIDGSLRVILSEAVVMIAFAILAVAGFKRSLWLVVAALFAHGLMDLFHPHMIANRGAPVWWPMFCMAFDVVAAGWVAATLVRSHPPSSFVKGRRSAD